MPQPFEEWTVLPHGRVRLLAENLVTVTGELQMPLGEFPRRMTVARMDDGALVVFSAIALNEAEMRALDAWGVVSYLVVPGDLHRMDVKAWKQRYPDAKVIAPVGAREKVEQVVPVDDTRVEFADPKVRFVVVPGTEQHEAALEVDTPTGTTLVVNDLIWNLDDRPGFGGWLFHLAGFTGSLPRIPTLVELAAIKDKEPLRAQLEAWASNPRLERILVAHGDIVDRDATGVLRGLANSLK